MVRKPHRGRKRFIVVLALLCASPVSAAERTYGTVTDVQWVSCFDGGTCTFSIPWWPPIIGNEVAVRFRGVDTPEILGKCPEEKELARQARDLLSTMFQRADRIELRDVARGKHFWIVATVVADGQDAGGALIDAGVARPYTAGARRSWCD